MVYRELRTVRQLKVCQEVLDLHPLEELVSTNNAVRNPLLLQCGLKNTRERVVANCRSQPGLTVSLTQNGKVIVVQ